MRLYAVGEESVGPTCSLFPVVNKPVTVSRDWSLEACSTDPKFCLLSGLCYQINVLYRGNELFEDDWYCQCIYMYIYI